MEEYLQEQSKMTRVVQRAAAIRLHLPFKVTAWRPHVHGLHTYGLSVLQIQIP